MDQANEPLAHRLRSAAIERTTTEAERVDDFVLDEDGVLDLRTLERDEFGTSVADPAKALATIRGRLGDAHEVSDLYDESAPEPQRWRLISRARTTAGQVASTTTKAPIGRTAPAVTPAPALNRLSKVPLSSERARVDEQPLPAKDTTVADTGVFEADAAATGSRFDVDLRNEARPTANCPRCMGLGHRDLFDRVSRIEFYSCDNCMHMWQQNLD